MLEMENEMNEMGCMGMGCMGMGITSGRRVAWLADVQQPEMVPRAT